MVTDDQVYRDLQKFLDTTPAGQFPSTKTGADIRLLKHLFTPDEARIATFLTMKPEPIETVYDRIKESGMSITIQELQQILDSMLVKGTIRPYYEGYDKIHYRCTDTTAGGFLSVQVDRLSNELIDDMMSYMMDSAQERQPAPKEHSPLRTVPVQKSIPYPEKYPLSDYDSLKKLVENAPGPFAVANCICRQKTRIMGGKCGVTDLEEACLMIGPDQARRYVKMGIGRFISRDEVFDILGKAQEAGLVLQPENSQRPEAICCCCGDCCVFLANLKRFPRPADMYLSNYYAKIDPESCTDCGTCVERCQLEACVVVDGVTMVNRDRCIGCGNCVAFCPSNAITLFKKDEEIVPVKDKETYYMSLSKR